MTEKTKDVEALAIKHLQRKLKFLNLNSSSFPKQKAPACSSNSFSYAVSDDMFLDLGKTVESEAPCAVSYFPITEEIHREILPTLGPQWGVTEMRMPSLTEVKKHLTEDEFKRIKEELYNEVLTINREELCKRVTPDRHFPLLRQRKVFDRSTEEVILAEVTTQRKAARFVDELQRVGGVSAFPVFIESIDNTQVHLKELLNKSYEELQDNIPISILSKHTKVLQVIGEPRAEITPPSDDDRVHPPVDLSVLKEIQESYNLEIRGEEFDEDDEENDLIQEDEDELYLHDGHNIQDTNQNQL